MKPEQRFIAGAICPECNAMDALLLNLNDQSITCVDCSYTQIAEQRDSAHQQQKATQPKKVDAVNIIKVTNINS